MISPARARRALKATSLVTVATTAGVLAISSAGADAPDAYGWWYEANSGLPVAPPPPPSVPNNGLYVENGFSGPAAISALSFEVPSGTAVGALVLHVSGTAVMSKPPVACPLTSPIKSVQEGRWSERPSYDCNKAQVTGQVDSAMTTVTFDTSSLVENGQVSVAILAGGPADAVAFDAPGSDALAVTPVSAAPSATGPTSAGAPQGTSAPSFTSSPQAPLSIGVNPGITTSTSAASVPGTAGEQNPGGAGGGTTHHVAAAAKRRSSLPSLVAQILGLATLGLLLVAWTEGYGILGGRIKGLASPLARTRGRSSAESEREQPGTISHEPRHLCGLEPAVSQTRLD